MQGCWRWGETAKSLIIEYFPPSALITTPTGRWCNSRLELKEMQDINSQEKFLGSLRTTGELETGQYRNLKPLEPTATGKVKHNPFLATLI